MNRGNGSIVGTLNTPTSSAASGSFSLYQIQVLDKAGQWPSYTVTDLYWPNVTALLPGTGANGGTNNTFLDSSTTANSLTRYGTLTQGTFNPYSPTYSVFFDGTGDSLTFTGAAGPEGTQDFTVEMYAYITTMGGSFPRLFESTTTGALQLYLASGVLTYGQFGSAAILSFNISSLTNQWVHICVTRSGSAVRIFINGVLRAYTASGGTNFAASTSWKTSNEGGGIVGYISNLRVVRGSVVAAYSTAVTTTGTTVFTPPTTPLTAVSGTSLLTCQSNRFNDNSANNFAVTRAGNVAIQTFQPFNFTASYAAGTMGGSLYANGSTDYLQTTNTLASLNPAGGDFTIEFWMYPRSSARQDLFNIQATDGSFNRLAIIYTGGNLSYFVGTTGGATAKISGAITAANFIDTWHHVALSRSGSNTRMFVNGVQAGTTYTTLDTWTSSMQMTLMRDINAATYATGYMSNVRMLKGTALYTANFTPPTAPLTNITNTSILLNFTNGAVIDNAITNDCVTVDNTQISTAQSKFGGGSIAFDGTNDYLSFPASRGYDFASGDWTVECWVYFSSVASTPYIWQIGSAAGTRFSLFLTGGVLNVLSSGTTVLASSTSLSTGQWYHLAVTYVATGTTTRLFINGTLNISTSSYSAFPKDSGTLTLALGWQNYAGGAGDYLNGYMNDFRITKGVARYTASFTPPGTPFPTA